MKHFISILFVFLSLQTFSQKPQEQWVKNVRGEFAITADMVGTAIDAKESARADAKRRAIEQVCGQRVNIWDKMELSAAGESFNSLAVVQTDGEIVEFEVVKEDFEKSAVRSSEMIFYCIANVKVRTGIRPDPNFSAKADGIRSVYFESETLNVSVTPLRDCYLKIFIFENQGTGYLLYPNVNEPSKQLFANQTVAFPQVDEWAITKETDKPRETNQIVFVCTKTDWQFPATETSRSEIEKWIMKIPADQRYIDIKTIEIRER
ncbi:MAG: DUF4384 domain-containing protein [Bacteroidales bacterium]|nr:DUF4384 domain-containing protein [Bacteroidales bacterium]